MRDADSRHWLPSLAFLASMGCADPLRTLFQCRAKFCPNLYHRSATPKVMDPSHTEPLMERIGRTLSICKRIRRSRDTPPVDLHPNVFARLGKNSEFQKDVKEVWFVGAHSGMVFPIMLSISSRPSRGRWLTGKFLIRRRGWPSEGYGRKRAVEHLTALDDKRNREGTVPYPIRRNRARSVEHPDHGDRASSHSCGTRGVGLHVARRGHAGQLSRFVGQGSERKHEHEHQHTRA